MEIKNALKRKTKGLAAWTASFTCLIVAPCTGTAGYIVFEAQKPLKEICRTSMAAHSVMPTPCADGRVLWLPGEMKQLAALKHTADKLRIGDVVELYLDGKPLPPTDDDAPTFADTDAEAAVVLRHMGMGN